MNELMIRSKASWGYDPAFMEACREELTLRSEHLEVNPTFVLEYQRQIAGVYSLEPGPATESGTVELGLFFLEPGIIGLGFGRLMMNDAVGRASARGFCRLVVQSDPHAEGFYRTMGFIRIGARNSESVRGRPLPLLERRLAGGRQVGSAPDPDASLNERAVGLNAPASSDRKAPLSIRCID